MIDRKRVIVAGVGDLEAVDPALTAAAEVAKGCGGELHLVHGYELPRLFTMAPGMAIAYPEAADAYHRGMLEKLQAAARAAGVEGAQCHVAEGAAGACVLHVAKEAGADLLVVGAARGPKLLRRILGTTAQRVLREARVPVLVARGTTVRPVGRLLLTGDMSDLSAAVQETALAMVECLFGQPGAVRSLYVLPWSLVPPPLPQSALEEAARKQLQEFLGERTPRGYTVAPGVRVGMPAEEIVEEAREWHADLVVVGTHARGWGARLVLGSVAEAALRDAPCNVLAVPPCRAAVGETEPEATCVESPDLALWAEAAGVA